MLIWISVSLISQTFVIEIHELFTQKINKHVEKLNTKCDLFRSRNKIE